jgi:hypothetical protein
MLYIIYRIRAETADGLILSYYGHTKDFEDRKGKHESAHRAWVAAGKPEKTGQVGASRSVLILDHEGWTMQEVATIECDKKEDAEDLESEWIRNNECVNLVIPNRTPQEWSKQYNETHKEEKCEYNRLYYEDNKEKAIQYQRQYHQKNKEKINAKRAEKVKCDVCGSVVHKSNISTHQKTKKCLAAKLSQSITTNAFHVSSCA